MLMSFVPLAVLPLTCRALIIIRHIQRLAGCIVINHKPRKLAAVSAHVTDIWATAGRNTSHHHQYSPPTSTPADAT